MKFPKPFLISLTLFTAMAAAVLHLRSASRRTETFKAADSTGSPGTPGLPDTSKPAPAAPRAPAPTVEEILRMNPAALRAAAAALIRSPDPLQAQRLVLICSRIAELDPDDGADWLFALPDEGESSNGFFAGAGFLSTWLADERHDPAELLSHARNAEAREKRLGMLWMAATMMGMNAATSARITAAMDREAIDRKESILAAQTESAHSPGLAVTRLLALPDSEEQRAALSAVLRALADEDPAEALKQAERVPFSGTIPNFVERVLEKVTKDQPSAALDYIASHPGPVQTTDFLKRHDTLLAAAGPDAVLAAAAKVTDPDIRNQIIGHAAVGLSRKDPFAAARLMGGLEADTLIMPLWREVAAGFAALPESRQQEWLQTLPDGPAKDAAVSALSGQRTVPEKSDR